MWKRFTAGVSGLLASGVAAAQAVPVNVTDAVAQIGETQTDVVEIGTALIVLAAVGMGLRWLKAQFF